MFVKPRNMGFQTELQIQGIQGPPKATQDRTLTGALWMLTSPQPLLLPHCDPCIAARELVRPGIESNRPLGQARNTGC